MGKEEEGSFYKDKERKKNKEEGKGREEEREGVGKTVGEKRGRKVRI